MHDIKTIGIPRGLMAYRDGNMWKQFFELLGYQCIVSGRSTKEMLERGMARAIDETCLPFKLYLGHVEELLGKCDAIFVPRMGGYKTREKMCTRYEALPDLIRNIFREEHIQILTVSYDWYTKTDEEKVYMELGLSLGKSRKDVKKAYGAARKYQDGLLRERERKLWEALEQSGHKGQESSKKQGTKDQESQKKQGVKAKDERKPVILLAGHPYVIRDAFMGRELERILKGMGATVLFSDDVEREAALKRSYHFSKVMPWLINREIVGAVMLLHPKVDGIVLVSAYPCGPDALVNDMLVRRIRGVPVLQLTLDAQNGTAGLETRIESFMDIIQYQKAGGYGKNTD